MKKIVVLLFLLSVFLVGCVKITATNKSYGDMLSVACDGFMSVDVTSLKNIKYISVDLDAIKDIKESDKSIITKHLKKKSNIEIKYDSLATLESNGLYSKDKKYLDGVLFTISEVNKIGENNYAVKGSVYRSGDNSTQAICTVEYINGSWKIVNTEIPKPEPAKS